MAEDKNIQAHDPAMSNTDLAYERTVMAHERTLMAWVRTALSMISFGFTIYKIFEEASKKSAGNQLFSPRVVGMVMISFGLLALVLAQAQHTAAMRKLKKSYPGAARSISSVISILVLLFGMTLFLGALFRQ
jgi:inner membrane protein YidH